MIYDYLLISAINIQIYDPRHDVHACRCPDPATQAPGLLECPYHSSLASVRNYLSLSHVSRQVWREAKERFLSHGNWFLLSIPAAQHFDSEDLEPCKDMLSQVRCLHFLGELTYNGVGGLSRWMFHRTFIMFRLRYLEESGWEGSWKVEWLDELEEDDSEDMIALALWDHLEHAAEWCNEEGGICDEAVGSVVIAYVKALEEYRRRCFLVYGK